jgi:DNA-binding CsgD family transcriptional regulator
MGSLERSALLQAADLDAVLRVLEECERVGDPAEFRMTALEAIARHLDYRHTTFFVGTTLRQAFADRSPVANGCAARLVGQYVEQRWESDIFSQPGSVALLRDRRVVSLDQLQVPHHLDVRRYIDGFMLRNGIRAKFVIRLDTPAEHSALMGIIGSESGVFGPRDYAVAALLGRHVGALLRLHSAWPEVSGPLRGLSPRQSEVAQLVAEGWGNEEISRALSVTVGTVKKHVTAALAVTGCSNRTQLAVAWRSARPA